MCRFESDRGYHLASCAGLRHDAFEALMHRFDSCMGRYAESMSRGGSSYVGPDGLTHYERNKEAYLERINARRMEIKLFVRDHKASIGCADCGIKDWRVLDYDHLPEFNKITPIVYAVRDGWSKKRILSEIAKCEVVCANCHRIRTCERRDAGL